MSNTQLIRAIEGFARSYEAAHLIWMNRVGLPADHTKLLKSPIDALRFLAAYAHARGGANPRFALYHRVAIDKAKSRYGENTLDEGFAETVWTEFERLAKGKPNEKLTKGPVKDILVELRKAGESNIIRHLTSKSLEDAYRWSTGIKGIGHKVASLILRDIQSYIGPWPEAPASSRKYLQPIDVWVRRLIQESLWPELNWPNEDLKFTAQLVDECQKSGTNDVELNEGAWFVGSHFERLCQFFGLPEREWVDFGNATKFDSVKVKHAIREFASDQYPFVL